MKSILNSNKATVYFDGIFSEPRLQHPEGVAIDNNGFVCCGTENGEIMRIEKEKWWSFKITRTRWYGRCIKPSSKLHMLCNKTF
jgi:hypothetical protein